MGMSDMSIRNMRLANGVRDTSLVRANHPLMRSIGVLLEKHWSLITRLETTSDVDPNKTGDGYEQLKYDGWLQVRVT